MKSCSLPEFIKTMEPWLSDDYIRRVYVDGNGDLELFFVDGVSNRYRIDECSRSQLEGILSDLEKKGIQIDR